MLFESIKLIILDVDGTLTDGRICYDTFGNEWKQFDVKDGLAIKVARAAGLDFAILTGRVSPMVERRAKELGIKYIRSGVQKKYPAMLALLEELGLSAEACGYIGDDWNDLQAMSAAAFRACPADAAEAIRSICHYTSPSNGGHGAVRDCITFLFQGTDRWQRAAHDLYFSSTVTTNGK